MSRICSILFLFGCINISCILHTKPSEICIVMTFALLRPARITNIASIMLNERTYILVVVTKFHIILFKVFFFSAYSRLQQKAPYKAIIIRNK